MPHGPTDFRSTVIKPFFQEKDDLLQPTIPLPTIPLPAAVPVEGSPTQNPADMPTAQPPRRRERPRKNAILILSADILIYLEDDLTIFSKLLDETSKALSKLP
ncbi:hypothetical protein B7494_g7858 [Chlorociboria aeruginascens]|nr:hypothetical protein B7494_g7858 [Chlorociboria aeruginascens]